MFPSRCKTFIATLCWLSALATAPALAETQTRYELDLSQRHTQTIGVRAVFENVTEGKLWVHLPAWRTGKYRILDTVGTLSNLRVTNADGTPLSFQQTAKSSWEIENAAGASGTVVFEYLVYARSLEDRTRDVNAEHVFINPGLVLVYAESHREQPVIVHADLPEGWKTASGMVATDTETLIAPSYDRLVDSPIEYGSFDLLTFDAAGATIEFAIYGDWDGDGERLENDVRAIVEAAAAVYDDMPTDRYVFITHSAPGLGGGTEYFNSTVVQVNPAHFWDPDKYDKFLNLLAHEVFHLWNVKRFRPAGIARYNYLAENYTELLWVAEGLTSYYDGLLLARSGVIPVKDYREGIAEIVDAVVDRPGYTRDSLAHASFEAWTKGYHDGGDRRPDLRNRTVSIYSHGSLLGLVLDLEIRGRSNGAHSLDDVMGSLYRDFPLDSPGYTYSDVRTRVEQVGGATLAEDLDRWVLGTDALPVADALARVGWVLDREDEEPSATLGVKVRAASGGQQVRYVRLEGPAWSAGLNVDDILLAIDDRRIGDGLDDLLTRYSPEDTVDITFFREGRLRRLAATLGPDLQDHSLEPAEMPDETAVALRDSWLGGQSESEEEAE